MLNLENLKNKSQKELLSIAEALAVLADKKKYNKIDFIYPNTGTLSRDKYPKQLTFFKKGKDHLIRALFGANGCGKTLCGAYEFACHLTGLYPEWWEGRKFTKPIRAWGCAREAKQLREAMQEALFGDPREIGTGLIPRDCLIGEDGKTVETTNLAGTAGCIGTCRVKHYTNGLFDGYSSCSFKTYAQGWQEFQGANRDLIWLDEEPDEPKIHSECIARLRGKGEGTEGSLYYTMTPLLGYTTIYLSFLPNGQVPKTGTPPNSPEKFSIVVTDQDVPHLTEKIKAAMLEEWRLTDPTNIDARKSGIAAIGSGRIFPVDEDFIKVKPFEIPEYWPRAYGLDFGWHATAVCWIAQDPHTKIKYVYAVYKRGKQPPYVHVAAIKAKGDWISGAADPSGGGRNQHDGSMLIDEYRKLGLTLIPGENSINAGIASLLNQMETGMWKVFSTCTEWFDEFRLYRYDMNDPNKPAAKQEDHLMDSSKYANSIFEYIAKSYIDATDYAIDQYENKDRYNDSRDRLTGY